MPRRPAATAPVSAGRSAYVAAAQTRTPRWRVSRPARTYAEIPASGTAPSSRMVTMIPT